MIIEPAGSLAFTTSLAHFERLGFHASSAFASSSIESVGFLPNKILDTATHQHVLGIAENLGFTTNVMGGYEEWLRMLSVTFTKHPDAAIDHAKAGRACGQGLIHIRRILDEAERYPEFRPTMARVRETLDCIANSAAVVYAVDLSGLGPRLVEPSEFPSYYRVHWPPAQPVPDISVVGPERIIARLDF